MSGSGRTSVVAGPGGAGPAVVAIGGGHGLAATLRAARRYAGGITAVVSVADDGGSSGRLRNEMPDLPAPGDVRRCLSALAAEGSVLGRTLERRFPGQGEDAALGGHPLGNLLLASLTAELGSFAAAVDEVATLVGAAGRVLPATSSPVLLEGHLDPHASAGPDPRVVGQVAVQNSRGIRRLCLRPPEPPSPPEVARAILAADQVVLGPGSLFTSVLAAAIVPAVLGALADTGARRVYVANLRPGEPETAGLDLAGHLDALAAHGVPVDVVLCDRGACAPGATQRVPVVERPVAAPSGRSHDPDLLAAALAGLVPAP